jgi:hypothetical protein
MKWRPPYLDGKQRCFLCSKGKARVVVWLSHHENDLVIAFARALDCSLHERGPNALKLLGLEDRNRGEGKRAHRKYQARQSDVAANLAASSATIEIARSRLLRRSSTSSASAFPPKASTMTRRSQGLFRRARNDLNNAAEGQGVLFAISLQNIAQIGAMTQLAAQRRIGGRVICIAETSRVLVFDL